MKTYLRIAIIVTIILSILSACNQKKETSTKNTAFSYTINRESKLSAYQLDSKTDIRNQSRTLGEIKGLLKAPIFLSSEYSKSGQYVWNDSIRVSIVKQNTPQIHYMVLSDNTLDIDDIVELKEADETLIKYLVTSKTYSNITKINTGNDSTRYIVEGQYSDTITLHIAHTTPDKNAQLLLVKRVFLDQSHKQIKQEMRKIVDQVEK